MSEVSKARRSEATRKSIAAACKGWIERLTDLTRRNKLLYFKKSTRRSVEWTGTASPVVVDLLEGRTVGLSRIAVQTNDPKIQTKLSEIRKVATVYREERGLETLFLALGIATWDEPEGSWAYRATESTTRDATRSDDNSLSMISGPPLSQSASDSDVAKADAKKTDIRRPPSAPVLLLPVSIELKTGSAASEAHLKRSGDIQVNPVLLFALEDAFRLEVGADSLLSSAGDAQGPDDITTSAAVALAFERLKALAAGVKGFEIANTCVLSNFHFQKMAMVRDLKDSPELIEASDIVAAIVGDLDLRTKLAADRVTSDPRMLDFIPPKDEFLILDADSSQQVVIHNIVSSDTSTGVVHGPPGTGKSQTIVNLIAGLIARGKRVLFVAEKRAALDVVLERLRQTKLDHLTLDLHGAEISRASLMQRLRDSYEIARRAQEPKSDAVFAQLTDLRRTLNEHSRRINEVRPSIGLSVFEIEGELISLEAAASKVRWRAGELSSLGIERAERAQRLLDEACSFGSLFLRDGSSPWYKATFIDGLQVRSVCDVVSELDQHLLPSLLESVNRWSYANGIPAPASVAALRAQVGAIWEMKRVLSSYKPELMDDALDELAVALQPAKSSLSTIRAYLFDPRFRKALATVRGYRKSKTSIGSICNEVSGAISARRHWLESCKDAKPETIETAPIETILPQIVASIQHLAPGLDIDLENMEFGAFVRLLRSLRMAEADAGGMLRVRQIEDELRQLGVIRVVDEIRSASRSPALWSKSFRYAWLASQRDEIYAHDDALSGFRGDFQNQRVREFVDLDKKQFALAAERIRSLHGERVIKTMNDFRDQEAIVRREMAKKSRYLPLRRLLESAEDVVMAICPCWMASPLSVSQLLGAKQYFDVVIFDEASQILPEDAVPAIARSRRAVVAGDEHQLPPTTFFMGMDDDDDDDVGSQDSDVSAEETSRGVESILAQMQSFLTPWWLLWHYRSRDERLISFSNHHIYRDSLVTFPGPGRETPIEHVVINEPPREGEEKSVGAEVDRVVQLVLDHAEKRPNESLGVITMGIAHQRRVDAAIDASRSLRPDLDEFFDEGRREKFFVKNLERVQGDERDAIILSIGYGKDRGGKLPYHFGPLLKDGGERRLNVAVTRAKNQVKTVSSFSDADMDPLRSKAKGVELLRLYVQYARSGGTNLGMGEGLSHVPLNPFEADIADALEREGIHVLPQWGASGYRIDLVARHPTKPGRFVLAIECDGAAYHNAPTARDRDRLRQQHLEALGWRFHRIWSTDWFLRRAAEIERAKRAYETAVSHADNLDNPNPGARDAAATDDSATSLGQDPEMALVTPKFGPFPVPRHQVIDYYSIRDLVKVIEWLEKGSVRRTREELIREAARQLGFAKVGARIRERLDQACILFETRRSAT